MHLLATQTRLLDQAAAAADLGQSAADVVVLSFTDSDLAVLAAAHGGSGHPSLRLANLNQLKHPYSVDIYIEKTCAGAKFVLVRLLGGVDYWRYGVDELAASARTRGYHLAIVPGDHREDPRMDEASTLDVAALRQVWAYFQEGGPQNMAGLLGWMRLRIPRPVEAIPSPPPSGGEGARRADEGQRQSTTGVAAYPNHPGSSRPSSPRCGPSPHEGWGEGTTLKGSVFAPVKVAPFGLFGTACHPARPGAGRALVVFYRSVFMAADTLPVTALADALKARSLGVDTVYVTSLKDPAAATGLAELIAQQKPDIIINTTAFSGRGEGSASVLDSADAPVLQVMLAGCSAQTWAQNARGLGAADIAMNVVLPEIDGRLITRAISFKAQAERSEAMQFSRIFHQPDASRIEYVADLAANWVKLRRAAPADRRIACILSDYPGRGGRSGYAVGLDTPASVALIASAMRRTGYSVGRLPTARRLMRQLTKSAAQMGPALGDYRRWFAALPETFRASVCQHWGEPDADPAVKHGAFQFRFIAADNFTLALQPPRASGPGGRNAYHDTNRPPCHGYIAFYLWLRFQRGMDAMIHCGTHGTLEWLPGKAVALSQDCAAEILLGAAPVIYPFIVNNPGEAAAAKRRLSAIALGHMTPPLTQAGSHGAGLELESLLDEYADASSMDPRRARHLAAAIVSRAQETGLAADCGLNAGEEPEEALSRLDAFLCDAKEMRIRDGLHVFGRAMPEVQQAKMSKVLGGEVSRQLKACASSEISALLRALDGRFIQPGPGGAPSRGRMDVLPTGRNLYSVDPRNIPTSAAYDIGQRLAAEIMDRHAQDHGEWPGSIVMDLWGSATMRTGGDEIAQALALMGVRPLWDPATARVLGFEVIPQARLERPRVDVTLRISGLFRDVFAVQIALLDQAVEAVAALDEEDGFNPLAAARRAAQARPSRIFGSAPGAYGAGFSGMLAGGMPDSAAAGAAYLNATSHAYGGALGEGTPAAAAFRTQVAAADAFVHIQDMDEQDVLDSTAFAEHEGGFAAAAKLLGNAPALYHADSSRSGKVKIRTLREEVARVLRARASNPKWIAGQMRHGFRGAAEIAETVDNLFAFAALAGVVENHHFDLLFDAYCDADAVRAFLLASNPEAAAAIASRLEEAQNRGFWSSRRNSVAARLAEMKVAG